MRRQSLRNLTVAVGAVVLLAAMASPGRADRGAGELIPALLLPGYGQASEGHYTKSAVFAGITVAGWIGLFATQINYNRAVEQYDLSKSIYTGFGNTLASGGVVLSSDITAGFTEMANAWDTAERRYTQRNIFAGALIAVYALNALDVLLSEPDTGERISEEPAVTLDFQHDGVMVIKSFRF